MWRKDLWLMLVCVVDVRQSVEAQLCQISSVFSLRMHTFAIRDRRKDLTRNLHLSSSVCIMTRAKDVPASIREVLSSIVSICAVPHAYGVPSAVMLSGIKFPHVS